MAQESIFTPCSDQRGPTPRTRLAPSPTGALHLGNARTFLVNWAIARNHNWAITLRIEDLDTPRVKPGVIDLTIDLLRWLGIDWDAGPLIQSTEPQHHLEAMQILAARGQIYPSAHTRTQIEESAQLAAAASAPQEGSHELRFPASLRPPSFNLGDPTPFEDAAPSWRFATPPGPVSFLDVFAGPQSHDPAAVIGDFILWTRRDQTRPGQPAYQLAVVVDDARQGITHIVRGDDLLESAARQLLLYRALNLGPPPQYCHLPLVKGADGKRLAKRHGDTRLDHYRAKGVPPERVIGLVAKWCGLTSPAAAPRPMSAIDFRAALSLDTIPKASITFTPEDDAWLLAR